MCREGKPGTLSDHERKRKFLSFFRSRGEVGRDPLCARREKKKEGGEDFPEQRKKSPSSNSAGLPQRGERSLSGKHAWFGEFYSGVVGMWKFLHRVILFPWQKVCTSGERTFLCRELARTRFSPSPEGEDALFYIGSLSRKRERVNIYLKKKERGAFYLVWKKKQVDTST